MHVTIASMSTTELLQTRHCEEQPARCSTCAVSSIAVCCLLLQQAEWLENVCTGICLVTIFMSIIVGESMGLQGCMESHFFVLPLASFEGFLPQLATTTSTCNRKGQAVWNNAFQQ